MYTVTKEFTFDAAHRLALPYESKCKSVHGHTFKVLITLGATELNNDGMVLDFTILKDLMKPIINLLDHAYISSNEKDSIIQKTATSKYFVLPEYLTNPTSENLARFIYIRLIDRLEKENLEIIVKKVTIYETPTSYATYYPEKEIHYKKEETQLQNKDDKIVISWERYNKYVDNMVSYLKTLEAVKNNKIVLFGVPRGGAVLANILAHKLNIDKLFVIHHESEIQKIPIFYEIWIVDDIWHTGHTVKNLLQDIFKISAFSKKRIFNYIAMFGRGQPGWLNGEFLKQQIENSCGYEIGTTFIRNWVDAWVEFPYESPNEPRNR